MLTKLILQNAGKIPAAASLARRMIAVRLSCSSWLPKLDDLTCGRSV